MCFDIIILCFCYLSIRYKRLMQSERLMPNVNVNEIKFNAKELGKKIADIRNREGLLQGEFADLMGVSKNTLSFYERGMNKPDSEFLYKLNSKFNVSTDWLLTGKTTVTANDNDFTLLPRYDVAASAGGGSFIEKENIRDKLSFNTEWLKRLGLNIDNAALLNASGDLMEPTIKDGSVLLIKLDEDEIKDGSMYVIQISGQTFVKRLKRDLKGIQILSDNPNYPEQFLTYAELEHNPIMIAGRVIWYGVYA